MARPYITATAAAGLSLIAGLTSPSAHAVLMTYSESATISGTLGGKPFSDALIEITGTGDTRNIRGAHGSESIILPSLSFTLAGNGSGTFRPNPDQYEVFHNGNALFGPFGAGFLDDRPFGARVILATLDPFFEMNGLTNMFGPITGSASFSPGGSFPTTAGDLIINASGDSTIAAVVAAVPEPGSIALLAAAIVGFGMLWPRSKGMKG